MSKAWRMAAVLALIGGPALASLSRIGCCSSAVETIGRGHGKKVPLDAATASGREIRGQRYGSVAVAAGGRVREQSKLWTSLRASIVRFPGRCGRMLASIRSQDSR